jgi:lactoylglutathione lyase
MTTMTDRPFRILGIQQIAIGGSKAELRSLWVDLLGLPVVGTFRSEKENVDEDICTTGAGDFVVEIDLMEPIDPDRAPRVHQPPLNHIGLWVDALATAVEWLTSQGVRFAPGGIRAGASGYDVCFIHPRGNEQSPIGGAGVLIELVQAPPSVVSAYDVLRAAATGSSDTPI